MIDEREVVLSVGRKDFDISWFSGKGAGGQHRNKHQNCCRILHRASGATGTGQTERSRVANQKTAFNTLVNSPKFKTWLKMETNKILFDYIEIEKKVDKEMVNIKVEYLEDGIWVEQ